PPFLLPCTAYPPPLHPFPTRRSSDLLRGTFDARRLLQLARHAQKARPRRAHVKRRRHKQAGQHHRRRRERQLDADRCQRRAEQRSEEHTSELQSPYDLVCRLLLEKKK